MVDPMRGRGVDRTGVRVDPSETWLVVKELNLDAPRRSVGHPVIIITLVRWSKILRRVIPVPVLSQRLFSGRAVEGCALARAPKTMSTAHRDPLRAHSVRRALLADGDGADGWWNDAHDQVRCAVPPRFFSARAPSRASTVPS